MRSLASELRRLNTSLLRLLKSSERWGNRKVLGWIGTGGTRISVTECIVITQAHDAHICRVETFETCFVAQHVNYKKKKKQYVNLRE